jgi:hypothetical protein
MPATSGTYRVKLGNPVGMATALEFCIQPRPKCLGCDSFVDQPLTEADHVGIVVLSGKAGGGGIVHGRGPDSGHLVGSHRYAYS